MPNVATVCQSLHYLSLLHYWAQRYYPVDSSTTRVCWLPTFRFPFAPFVKAFSVMYILQNLFLSICSWVGVERVPYSQFLDFGVYPIPGVRHMINPTPSPVAEATMSLYDFVNLIWSFKTKQKNKRSNPLFPILKIFIVINFEIDLW